MKIRLVKHVVDAHEEKISFQLYRDIEIPFVPHCGLILTDSLGSEFIQAMGYILRKDLFEGLVYPKFVTREHSAESIKDSLEKTGWKLDKGKSVLVDFEGKLDEEQAVQEYLESESPSVGEDLNTEVDEPDDWKKKHDDMYPDNLPEVP